MGRRGKGIRGKGENGKGEWVMGGEEGKKMLHGYRG